MVRLAYAALACALVSSPANAASRKPATIIAGSVVELPSGDTLQLNSPSSSAASINLPHGIGPSSPNNGDCWTTTSGAFCRINGTTSGIGPQTTLNLSGSLSYGVDGSQTDLLRISGGGSVGGLIVAGARAGNTSGLIRFRQYTEGNDAVLIDPATGILTAGNTVNAPYVLGGSLTPYNRGSNWVETVRPYSTSISSMGAISPAGQIGMVTASRTSDANCPGCMGTIGLESVVVNDNVNQRQTAYGAYIEATRGVNSPGTTHGVEIDVINKSSLVAANPVYMHNDGITPALWIASGGESSAQPATMAIGITNNGSKFDKGIMFQQGVLNTRVDGKQEAISIPQLGAISFYDTNGNIVGNIYGQGTYTDSAVNMRFDAGKLVFEKVDGTPILSIEQSGLRVGGAAGVSCSGPPTASFAVTNGIVTHC